MNWKIERHFEQCVVVLCLCGWIDRDGLDTLRETIGHEKNPVAIDLGEVMLVDREVVRFLVTSEARGIELRNCPAYIREWVTKVKESR